MPGSHAVAIPVAFVAFLSLAACETDSDEGAPVEQRDLPSANALPPEPTVTVSASPEEGVRVEHGEVIEDVDEARRALHAQHHPHGPLETRRLPGPFDPPPMTSIPEFALLKEELIVINPGPGEYVHVMEGQRHGYRNLTVGITYTAPGGAPPMHTHAGEEHTCCSRKDPLRPGRGHILHRRALHRQHPPSGAALVHEPGMVWRKWS